MKKTASILILSLILSAAWGQTGSELFQEGRDAFSDKLFSRAVESFREFIEQYPADPRVDQADYMIGVSLFYLKKYDQVITHFERYERKYPGSAYLRRIHYWKGLSYYADGVYRNAIGEFRRQVEFTGELYFRQKSYQFLGYCYEKSGMIDEALEAYQSLIDLNPDKNLTAQALERRGILYLNEGDYETALNLFTALTVEFKEIPQLIREVPFYMGECYYRLGDYENSIAKFENFLSLYSSSENREQAIFRLGSLYAMKEDQDAAKEFMTLLTRDYPDSEYRMEAHIVLAESYLLAGELDTARKSLEELLKSVRDPVEIQKIQFNMARTWEEEPDKALEWYILASRGLDPDLASESLYRSGRIYDDRGEKERSILLFERLFNQYKTSPHREEAGEWMAVYYERQSQDLALRNHLDRMLREYPETEKKTLFLYMRGNVSYREGNFNESLRYYQNVLNVEKEDETILNETRYRIGYIYTIRKEFSRAREYFDAILDNSEINELYYRALLSSGICYLNVRDEDKAQEIFTRVTQARDSDPWRGEAYYYLGQISMERGNYYRASEHFTQAAKTGGTETRKAEALYQLGWSRMRLSDFREASESFEALYNRYPEHPLAGDSLYRAGTALAYLEEWKQALDHYLPALEIITHPALREELLYQTAWSYFMLEQFDTAMGYIRTLQSDFPESPLPADGLYRAAEALMVQGKTGAAVHAYTQVFRIFPASPLAETALYRALSISQDTAERLKLMKEFLTGYSGSSRALQTALQLEQMMRHEDLGDDQNETVNAILDLPLGSDLRSIILLGRYYRELDRDGILTDLETLSSLPDLRDQERQKILLFRGIALYHAGKSDEAEEIFTGMTAVKYPDLGAEAQFYLARILTDRGAWKDGADAYLRIRYRYTGQKEWISRALYEASLAYLKTGDYDSFSRTAEMLQNEYPESELNRLLSDEMSERSIPDSLNREEDLPAPTEKDDMTEPDFLSPPDEILPVLEGN